MSSLNDKIEISELKDYIPEIKTQLLEFIEETTAFQPEEEDEFQLKLNSEQVKTL